MPDDNGPTAQEDAESEEDAYDPALAALIPQYLALCQRDLMQLKTALDRRDFEAIRRLGHNLKGSGGAYGFADLSIIGSDIETAGKAGNSEHARKSIDELAHFLNIHPPSM